MNVRLILGITLASLLSCGSAGADPLTITVDEFGNGIGTVGGGFLSPDPGPGGRSSVLTYRLSFAGTPGDVLLFDPLVGFGGTSDLIRFNGNGTLLFYSDTVPGDPAESPGDPPSFPLNSYLNFAALPEVGPEGSNGATYTPLPGQSGLPGQPGFDPLALPTYVFISDGVVPEPSSAVMAGTAVLGVLGCWWCRRRTVV